MPETTSEQAVQKTTVSVSRIIELAKQGRTEVMRLLREVLDERPELWQHYGDLGRQAEAGWLQLIAGENLYLRESTERHAAALRESLAGQEASPLEQLQAERIVALNLQVGYYEALLAQQEGSGSERVVAFLHERSGVADQKLQQAMMNLARIRKLLPQTLHVNVTVSGELQTTVRQGDDNQESPLDNGPARMQVPANRIKDLLAAARN